MMKDRLDVVLPDFARVSWVSDPAREVWEPRIRQINQAWAEMEWRSVLAGVRPCALTAVSPENLITQGAGWAGEGLNVLPVEIQGLSNYCYANSSIKAEWGKPFVFRVVVGRPYDVSAFKGAWDRADQKEIGRLLGYPPCCQDFFQEVWVEQKMVDTTWPMAVRTVAPENGSQTVEFKGPPEANILWRWLGVRPVPHLPCRMDCQASVEVGNAMMEVGRKSGYDQEITWLLELLSWPVEWSALHGIAEVKTPLVKFSTRTDSTASKYIVRCPSDTYPQEWVEGLRFPYYQARSPRVTDSTAFHRGLENLIQITSPHPPWYATDNGFQSIVAMETAHQPIVDVAVACLAGKGGAVLDLGCGNGALVKKILAANSAIVPYGIERDPKRIDHAQSVLPEFANNFITADLFEAESMWTQGRRYALALLMPGRLLEVDPAKAAKLKTQLDRHCDYLLVYAYGDWLTKYGNLQGLARKVGLVLLSAGAGTTASLARLL